MGNAAKVSYDYDRSTYMRRYYRKNRDRLLKKALARYRENRDALAQIARMKYKPKFKRHNY